MARTVVPGRPSRTCQTSTVHCDRALPGSNAAAGRGIAQQSISSVAKAFAGGVGGSVGAWPFYTPIEVAHRAITTGQAMPGRPLSPLPWVFFLLFRVGYVYS